MSARKSAPGAISGPSGTQGATPKSLNASNGLSNVFKHGRTGRVDRKALAVVHVAAQQLGLSDVEYRSVLRRAAGVDSAKHLNREGFLAVMQAFERLGFASRPGPRLAEREGMASPAQIRFIEGMWRKWHGGDDPAALRRWLSAKFHVSDLRFATVPVAQQAIQGLRAMLARGDESSTRGAERPHDKE